MDQDRMANTLFENRHTQIGLINMLKSKVKECVKVLDNWSDFN